MTSHDTNEQCIAVGHVDATGAANKQGLLLL
jgi:hypothetical protein